MSEEPDFDINNWDIENLLELFNIDLSIEKGQIISYAKHQADNILERVKDDKDKYKKFLDSAVNKLDKNEEKVYKVIDKITK